MRVSASESDNAAHTHACMHKTHTHASNGVCTPPQLAHAPCAAGCTAE
jgi:hypothetical protein